MHKLSRIHLLSPLKATAAVYEAYKPLSRFVPPVVISQGATRHLATSECKNVARKEDGEWLHKLDYTQKVFFYGHRAGTRYGAPTYTFRSREPLSYDVVHKAMEHAIRKSSVYQTVVREKDGELWWYKGNEAKVDFKIHRKGPSKTDVLEELWEEGFDEANGPLWRTRLIESLEDDGSASPELKKEYPHQYYFISCPHHALVDGLSAALFSQPIIDIINALIEGDEIDDSKPIGEFVTNEEYVKADAMLKEKLSQDPPRLEALKEKVVRANKTPLLFRYYPRPVVDKARTKHTFVKIEPGVLGKFLKNCKNNGLTYGTSLQTVTNTALVEMAQEAGAVDDTYELSVNITLDTRRYLKKRKLPTLGLHARQMTSLITMEKNPREKFWDNCREIHQINKEFLKSGSAIEQDVIRQHFLPCVPAEEFFRTRPPLLRDYAFNNVGPLDPHIHGRGKHAQITRIESYQASHKYTFPFYQQLFTYRGSDINMISYSSDCLSDETADKLVEKIQSIIVQHAK